jgi:hypothetical protein
MKKRIIASSLCSFLVAFTFSQNVYQGYQRNGCRFVKRIEPNLIGLYSGYNFDSKGDVERLLFGDLNAPMEFFYEPSFEGASGFRVIRDSLDVSYILEVKYISNYERAQRFNPGTILSHYQVEVLSLSISNQLAEKLCERLSLFIYNFTTKDAPVSSDEDEYTMRICLDGYTVTFRTVVDDEVWSLWIHMPQNDALRMSKLCLMIISDAKENRLDEAKYMSILSTF